MNSTVNKSIPIPQALTSLEWIWVLTNPLTSQRDAIFVIEMNEKDGGQRRVVPIFESREDAVQIKARLCKDAASKYSEQAMQLGELGNFAARNKLEIMLLDQMGTIMAHLEAKLERVSVH